jgi:Hint domain
MAIVYHKLSDDPLTQKWSSGTVTTSDDWSGSIQGFSSIQFAGGVGGDARTLLFDSEDSDVSANVMFTPSMYDPDDGDQGGVAEFQDFGMVGLAGGENAAAPNLVIYLDTTGVTSPMSLDFTIKDLDGNSHDTAQQINVQYRIGETGLWTNLPGGYFADVTAQGDTPDTQVSLALPPELLGQEKVQIRILTVDSNGQDEWVGIDDIHIACFARGTMIRTPRGEVAVETLAIGDDVTTLDGATRPVKWIGRRAFSTRFLSQSSRVAPVLIRANAIADGVPCRDLRVSPEHAIFIDGVLVPAINLVNGQTIVRDLQGDVIEYFHIELDDQSIVYADGAPAETYVNHNNRKMFANWPEYAALYGSDEPRIAADGEFERVYACVTSGPVLEAITARIERRTGTALLAA